MIQKSIITLLIFMCIIVPISVFGQSTSPDGYAIITSRDTILGVHHCYTRCQDTLECPERSQCAALPNIGSVCLAIRPDDALPDDWFICESDLECTAQEQCIRQAGPRLINTFIEHKEDRGFDVHLIDETVWGGGQGDEAADHIRAWLQANYELLNLRYVLLIGDPRPTGDVPMRSSRPSNNAHQSWASNFIVFTDFYYADLDGDWDLDQDGHLAEYHVQAHQIQEGSPASQHRDNLTDDMGEGGANRDAEVAVGRIPFYGNPDDLDHILQKTMEYENEPEDQIAWRHSALLAAEGERRAFFGELIRSEILLPNHYEAYRVYDVDACWDHVNQQEDDCMSPIDGEPESLVCTPAHVETGLNLTHPGFVTWLTHGSGRGAQSVMLPRNVHALNDEYPFFTFQASCYNAQPTVSDNLAYELLKNGAIGTIGATTISHGPGSPMPSLQNDAGNAGMAYNFALRLIGEGMSAGEALNDLRRDVGVQNRWWYWKNYLTFNLWGDPSVGIYSHAQEESMLTPDAGGFTDMEIDDFGGMIDRDLIDAGELTDLFLVEGSDLMVHESLDMEIPLVVDQLIDDHGSHEDFMLMVDRESDLNTSSTILDYAMKIDFTTNQNEDHSHTMVEEISLNEEATANTANTANSGCESKPNSYNHSALFILFLCLGLRSRTKNSMTSS